MQLDRLHQRVDPISVEWKPMRGELYKQYFIHPENPIWGWTDMVSRRRRRHNPKAARLAGRLAGSLSERLSRMLIQTFVNGVLSPGHAPRSTRPHPIPAHLNGGHHNFLALLSQTTLPTWSAHRLQPFCPWLNGRVEELRAAVHCGGVPQPRHLR